MRELRVEFHQQLQDIDSEVIELFGLITEDITVATNAVLEGDVNALRVVGERETTIDALYRKVEDLLNHQMALQAPVASDLRLMLSILRIVPELERSHDLVVHITEHANQPLSGELSPHARELIREMGDLAADMWNQASGAWYERDATAAAALAERDNHLDSLHAAMLDELNTGAMNVAVTIEMTLLARFYERIGDHAVNIAKRVIYLAGRVADAATGEPLHGEPSEGEPPEAGPQ